MNFWTLSNGQQAGQRPESSQGTKYDFEAIKAEANIVDVIGAVVSLKKRGNLHEGCCPFHGEKTPSFKVYEDSYHCFGCGAHGDAIDFIMRHEGCDHSEAIERIVGRDFSVNEERRIKIRADRAERERQDAKSKEMVMASCAHRWEQAQPCEEHPYLEAKGVLPHMSRIDGKALLIPVYSRDGEIQCVQAISPKQDEKGKWPKLFPKNGTMKGGRLNFGIMIRRALICEGFSTGASIHECNPERVTVAFSCDGVIDIATELHDAGINCAIAADRKGLPKILKFASGRGIPVFLPHEKFDDFNDMHLGMGSDAVRAVFLGDPYIAAPEKQETPAPGNADEPDNFWDMPPAPAITPGVLPGIIENFANIQARLIGCDPAGIAMCAISACGAVIRDSIEIKVKRHEKWAESARLWVMMVGDPSTKKSPMMRIATSAVKAMDADMLRKYNRDIVDWKEGGESGDMPVPERLRIEDTTMEAAQEVCAASPNGILAIQDELSGWFGGIEKYAGGKGGAKDRSFWLQAYGGGTYAVNRISRKSILIDNLSISMIGGIQPDAIRRVLDGSTDDGLIQRFIPVILRPSSIGMDEETPDITSDFDSLIHRLHGMTPPRGFMGDRQLVFDDEAMKIRTELERRHHAIVAQMEGYNRKLSSHVGKYDGMFPRLCIIWHCIENANQAELPEIITAETAQRVATFLHEFILRHAMEFYGRIAGADSDTDIIKDIAGYILAHGVEKMTYRTFQRGSSQMRKITKEAAEPICQQLQSHGWIEGYEIKSGKLSATVNPRVHELFADIAEEEKSRRQEVRDMINGAI